jgi:hypothetical protein
MDVNTSAKVLQKIFLTGPLVLLYTTTLAPNDTLAQTRYALLMMNHTIQSPTNFYGLLGQTSKVSRRTSQ